jgi:hypothetical protein
MVPPQVIAPRGADWAASLVGWLLRLGDSGGPLWQTFEQIGQRRAARELRDMARRYEPFDAALARRLRAAALHDTTTSIKDTR